MTFAIRAAQPRDAAALLDLIRPYAAETRQTMAVTPDVLATHLFGPLPRAQALIAQDTTEAPRTLAMGVPDTPPRAIGLAVWHYDFDLVAGVPGMTIDDLFIDQSWRGRGISLAFFATLARRIVSEGGARLAWSPRVGAAPGLSLYRSLSAIPLSAWTTQTLTGQALRDLAN